VPRSSSLKRVSNAIWETLSKARHVNEKLGVKMRFFSHQQKTL